MGGKLSANIINCLSVGHDEEVKVQFQFLTRNAFDKMNSFFRLGLRQIKSIEEGLDQFERVETAALSGEITATLSALKLTIAQYTTAARSELVDTVQHKANEYLIPLSVVVDDIDDDSESDASNNFNRNILLSHNDIQPFNDTIYSLHPPHSHIHHPNPLIIINLPRNLTPDKITLSKNQIS